MVYHGTPVWYTSNKLHNIYPTLPINSNYPKALDFDIIRQNFYTASNLKDLFHNIHPKRIISFVHAIGLTNKL